jgi:16S rRNA (adenine1518-N6/adenine1519-N6)-dimethyltransferase
LIKAKKKFGQNFLNDGIILNKIIQSMPKDDLKVVEIGPGLGDLTKKLLQHKKVVAFEIDDDLCQILKSNFDSFIKKGQLDLKCKDVLQYWENKNLLEYKYNLIANLPYYIATRIILKLLKDDNCINILAMIQKEVAAKFCANHNNRDFGAISIITELVGESEILFDISPEYFTPVPKVTSSFLKIEKKRRLIGKEGVFQSDGELLRFERYLRVCFSAPRKTLRKNLFIYDKDIVNSYFSTFDIDPNTRPHQLSSTKYLKIFKKVEDERKREKRDSR